MTLTVNHSRSNLDDRDVRAALQYAIDRDQLVENLNPATTTAISVPGADLQPERWLAPEFRDRLRVYERDRERAGALLESAGFLHENESWLTPEGETFALDIPATVGDSAVERSIAAQLQSFGIDADYVAVEATTYRERLDYGYFDATRRNHPDPGTADVGRTRTADLVRRPPYRAGAPHSVYLGEELDRTAERSAGLAWERTAESESTPNGRLVYDDPEVLRSITVGAPPEGEPEGEVQDWPYLYHAAMANAAPEPERRHEHARICTWIYNYQIPELELAIERPRIVHRMDDWTVPPADDPVWERSGRGLHAGGLWAALGHGRIRRNGG